MGGLTMMKPAISGADLPYEDGIPLESDWHLDAMNLLINILRHFWQDRSDVYIGGNMFVYFMTPNSVKNIIFAVLTFLSSKARQADTGAIPG